MDAKLLDLYLISVMCWKLLTLNAECLYICVCLGAWLVTSDMTKTMITLLCCAEFELKKNFLSL